MKVHVFSICWNEQLMIPYFFKHYRERFKDIKFTIYDNMSTDASRQLILDNGAELIDHFTNDEIRDDLYLEIKNNCWKKSDADWVIVCDIDEWIDCNDEFLESTNCTIVKPEGYEMVGNTYNLDKIARGLRYKKYDKCVLFKPSAIENINYSIGCHKCDPTGNVIYNTQPVLLFHMKYFKPLYLIRRSKLFAKRLSKINKQNLWGFTYTRSVKDILYRYILIVKNSVKIRNVNAK